MAQETQHEKIIMQAADDVSIGSEFSHKLSLDALKRNQDLIILEASKEQCDALSVRFDLPAIYCLKANIIMSEDPIQMHGTMIAQIDQICAATAETIQCSIEEELAINFIETPSVSPNDSEIELQDEDCETIFYDGDTIDIGEAIAQSLYLAIDPFPRKVDANMILAKAGVISEEEMAKNLAQERQDNNPFSALSSLKKS